MRFILMAFIIILSIPLATISFLLITQVNAWRFGKAAFKSFINPGKDYWH